MALRVHRPNILPSPDDQYVNQPTDGVRIGVSLSGGGIRSAAFNLGVLQALTESEFLCQVNYLTAVSGGNYVASALAITAAQSDQSLLETPPPWAHGSPEERYLRHHTDYLAPGLGGRLWLVINILYGFVVNYVPFLAGAFLVGRVIGWTLGVLLGSPGGLVDWTDPTGRAKFAGKLLVGVAGLIIVVALVIVAYERISDGRGTGTEGQSTRRASAAAAVFGIGLLLLGSVVLLPVAIIVYREWADWLTRTVLRQRSGAFDTSFAVRIGVAAISLAGSLALAGAALLSSRRTNLRAGMSVFAAVGGSGMLLIPVVSAMDYATKRGIEVGVTPGDAVLCGVAAAVLLFMGAFVHNRRYSMHLFYRDRLRSAFALRRQHDDERGLYASPVQYGHEIFFSALGAELADRVSNGQAPLPKLVVCCSVNVTTHDAPVGRFAGSFTFEHDRCGGPLLGYWPTVQIEREADLRGTALTLPSIMAVSGAALSPLMGRFTYAPLRFLMALTNVRLGVWVPNPRFMDVEDSGATDPRTAGWPPRRWARVVGHRLRTGWREPGALYVLREALGRTGGNKRFIYVSDGGHFENLGLVELVRRRCSHILCFDAGADPSGTGADLARAVALARADLNAEVLIDPLAGSGGSEESARDLSVSGSIRYPDGTHARLIYTKAAVVGASTWDLRSFAGLDNRFPNHSTSQQVFSDEQFQAYRSLGHAAGQAAVTRLNLPEALGRQAWELDVLREG
jgi:hypothetical protein